MVVSGGGCAKYQATPEFVRKIDNLFSNFSGGALVYPEKTFCCPHSDNKPHLGYWTKASIGVSNCLLLLNNCECTSDLSCDMMPCCHSGSVFIIIPIIVIINHFHFLDIKQSIIMQYKWCIEQLLHTGRMWQLLRWASLDVEWLEGSDIDQKHLEPAVEKTMILELHAHMWNVWCSALLSGQNYIEVEDYMRN